MDITPHVNLLRSFRGERVDYRLLIGEGIDNAFDAGASHIEIWVSRDQLTFRDNGSGIAKDRLSSLFSLGEHGALSTTQLGRFGVGIKAQAVNAGDVFAVQSTSKDGRFATEVDWPALLRGGTWQIADPVWRPSVVGEESGTKVTISKLRSIPRITIDSLASDIAQRFYPAIAEGKQIVLNGQLIGLLQEPEMTSIVDMRLSLSDGRGAHLRAGILVSTSALYAVHVAYKHRIIMPRSSFGCDEYGGGTNKMFARLQLTGQRWHLAKFKNDLTDEDEKHELEDAVAKLLAPILEKCSTVAMTAALADMQERINDLIPDALAARRPKHLKPRSEPSAIKRPRRPGVVHIDKSDPNGPAGTYKPRPAPKAKLLITFDGVDADDGVGALRHGGKINRVALARDNRVIAQLLNYKDRSIAAVALVMIAFAIFEHGRGFEQPELPFEEFGKRIAKHLLLGDEIDATLVVSD